MDIFDQLGATPEQAGSGPKTSPSGLARLVQTVDGNLPLPDPEFTDGAAPPPKIYRDQSGRFVKGTSGNPSGRPPSFAWMIREATGQGVELLAFALGILRGDVKNVVAGVSRVTGELWTEEVECSAALKWEAAKWLKDQGLGKEVERMALTLDGTMETTTNFVEDCPDLTKLTTEEAKMYLALRMKAMQSRPASEQIVDAEVSDARADDR